ncbi:hypothetical protein DYB32_005610, partial [Aphanomyces invadans]
NEMDVSAIFDQMDTDHNGALDIAEFQHALLQLMKVPLTQEEFYALLDEVDTNNDGTVDLHEFTAFMKLVEDVRVPLDDGENTNLTKGRRAVGVGIRPPQPIAHSAGGLVCHEKGSSTRPLGPESSLLMLLGVPTNFRPSVTSTAVRMRKHTMEYVLSFPPPEVGATMSRPLQWLD